MSKRKKRIGTSAIQELIAIAEDGGPDQLRPSAFDHVAEYSRKHPDEFYYDFAMSLARASRANDGKARTFYYAAPDGTTRSVD